MICTFKSENIYLVFVFAVIDCVYVSVFLNLILNRLYRFASYNIGVFYSTNCSGLLFQFVAIVGAKGQVHVGSKEDKPGPTGKIIKHTTFTCLHKTLGRMVFHNRFQSPNFTEKRYRQLFCVVDGYISCKVSLSIPDGQVINVCAFRA